MLSTILGWDHFSLHWCIQVCSQVVVNYLVLAEKIGFDDDFESFNRSYFYDWYLDVVLTGQWRCYDQENHHGFGDWNLRRAYDSWPVQYDCGEAWWLPYRSGLLDGVWNRFYCRESMRLWLSSVCVSYLGLDFLQPQCPFLLFWILVCMKLLLKQDNGYFWVNFRKWCQRDSVINSCISFINWWSCYVSFNSIAGIDLVVRISWLLYATKWNFVILSQMEFCVYWWLNEMRAWQQ